MKKVNIKMCMYMSCRLLAYRYFVIPRWAQKLFTITPLTNGLRNIYQPAMQVIQVMSVLRHEKR